MKAKPEDLQSSPVGHLGICPKIAREEAARRELGSLCELAWDENAFLRECGVREVSRGGLQGNFGRNNGRTEFRWGKFARRTAEG